MSKRLAITISGAVSLGSFEAGVLYEVFQAIGAHNAAVGSGSSNFINIDVITGASAGGMTAAIAAQKAMFDSSSLAQPYANSLYNPWVTDVSIAGLLALQSDEDPTHSLLSSDLINTIATRYLLARYSTHLLPLVSPHSAIDPNKGLKVGLALSNINGLDYTAVNRNGAPFVYTRYQDQILFPVTAANDSEDFWTPVLTARACGAFPFAFRPVDIWRHRSEYIPAGQASNPNLQLFPSDPMEMTYTDGGVFQNEPLGMAKNLVDQIDNHFNNDSRFYLFISPHAKVSTQPNAITPPGQQPNPPVHAADANFLKFLERLVSAVMNQAGFQDWASAEELNKQINVFNNRAVGLQGLMLGGGITASTLAPVNSALLNALFQNAAPNDRPNAVTRLTSQFQQEYQQLNNQLGTAAADAWIEAILVLETAANIGAYDEMEVLGITATDAELASSALTAFMGFFDQRYRDHDYDVGRQKAQTALQNPAQLGGLGPFVNYQPSPIRPIDASLNGLTMAKADPQVVGNVRDRLEDSIKSLLSEAGVNSFELELAGPTIIKPAINKLLGL
jgi:predicted acylesterase/phospholipase RssA